MLRCSTSTPAGKFQMHILAAIAEFERARIAERVRAGLARVKAKGQRLGRRPHRITADDNTGLWSSMCEILCCGLRAAAEGEAVDPFADSEAPCGAG
jgi:hypothetical protein